MNWVGNKAKMVLCLAMLGGLTAGAGAQEVLEQWVFAVMEASSRPGTSAGSDDRISGAPNSTCETGDFNFESESWRPLEPDRGDEWITVRFAQPVYAYAIEVYEGFNPGAVVMVQVLDEEGKWLSVWEGDDPTRDCPGALNISFPTLSFPTSIVRILMNTSQIAGWNQLDAVKLAGFPAAELEFLFEEVPEGKIFKLEDGEEVPKGFSSYTFGDYDNDGWPDMFGRNVGYPGRIFMLHNEGDGTYGNRTNILPFQVVTSNAGRLFGDYDNDGDADLFISHGSVVKSFYGQDMLLRNDGREFTDVSTESGLTDSLVSGNAMYWDYDRDGWLDLYVGHGTWNDTVVAEGGSSTNSLYRNNGDGTFSDVTEKVGLAIDWEPGLPREGTTDAITSADFNDDGWPDLLVTVESGRDRLFLSNGLGEFIDATTEEVGNPSYTVSTPIGDIDHDGDLDLFQAVFGSDGSEGVSTNAPERSRMLLNLGGGQFLDVTEGVGLRRVTEKNIGIARLWDIDNDADLDLITSVPSMLFLNQGDGSFIEATSLGGISGSNAVADYDGDGFLDTWFIQQSFRNRGNDNHWLRIDLVGTESNRDGIGARVYARTGDLRQTRELMGGDGWLQDELIVHFGLGEATQVDELEVRWPSGQVDVIESIPADQEIRVIEGRGQWYPAPRTVWTIEPPPRVTYGQKVDFVAEVRPALFEPRAEITSITADLSSLGGPESIPLEDLGDGTYRLETRFAVGGSAELRDVEVFIEQVTPLGPHWINLSRNIEVVGDPNTAITEDYSTTLPDNFTLSQNYPNPFNSDTVIRFALPTAADVGLAIFNLAGQKVATPVGGVREAGTYSVRWDGRDDDRRALASGVYLYRLRTGDGQQVETRKLLLLR
jgi:enediyne biosynthesis protein E4